MAPGLPRPLLQSAGVTVMMLDAGLRVLATRGPASNRAMRGQYATDLLPFLAGLEGELGRIAQGRRPALDLPRLDCRELIASHPDYLSLHACRAQDGQGVILMLQDVAAAAQREQQRLQERNELHLARVRLEDVTAQAEAANRAKSTFLAHVSHELKTPLAVITGNADILAGLRLEASDGAGLAALEDEIHDYARDIRESGEFLAALVNDLLDIVRAESGRFPLSEVELDWPELVREVMAGLQRLPAARHVELVIEAGAPEIGLRADPLRLRQVLVNLLTNAIHAVARDGKVVIGWACDAAGGLRVEIKDNGRGLDAGLASRVFEPFAGSAGGTGLGLTIAKNLVELHGGDIGIQTRAEGGCLAWFTLPAARITEGSGT